MSVPMPSARCGQPSHTELTRPVSTARRWWIYQRERFPVFRFALMAAVFTASVLIYRALPVLALPSPRAWAAAFLCVFLLFFQMRVADEFKDREDDARYRPYRPVPRGLIGLRELGLAAIAAAVAQLALVAWADRRLLPLLFAIWAYLALMTREFFVQRWLRAHPVTYLWTHILITPLITYFVSAFVSKTAPLWLLAVTFFACVLLEVGRKLRSPLDEEPGVQTYTALWGRPRALQAWLGALLATAVCAIGAAPTLTALVLSAACVLAAAIMATRFARNPAPGRGRSFERLSDAFAMLLLLSMVFGA